MLVDVNKFSNDLIEAIKEHAKNCAQGEGVIDQAYKLAHYHIIELVNLLALRAEAEGKADSAGDLISREALKKAISEATYNFEQIPIRVDKVQEIIDNAEAVSDRYDEGFRDGYAQCINDKEERKENNRLFQKGGAE